MRQTERLFELRVLVAFLLAVRLEAVTVNPSLCPTNKIAPHKHIGNWQYGTGRTFGAFYDLLTPSDSQYGPPGNPPYGPPGNSPYGPPGNPPYGPPGNPPYGPLGNRPYGPPGNRPYGSPGNRPYGPPGDPQFDSPNDENDLQEQPQEDDPTDCGEIDDYDENDLSAITPQGNRRRDSRLFGSLFSPSQNYPQRPPNYPSPSFPGRPPNYPQRPPNYPPQRPPSTDRPQGPSYSATRKPYWSGGFFGSNDYRPPLQQNPSDSLKPIHEYSEFSQMPYHPSLVGGSLSHVVGVSPIIPTREDEPTTPRTFYNRIRSTPSTNESNNPTRRPRPRNLSNNGIFGSFVDLLF